MQEALFCKGGGKAYRIVRELDNRPKGRFVCKQKGGRQGVKPPERERAVDRRAAFFFRGQIKKSAFLNYGRCRV